MTDSPVPAIDPLRVDTVELAHARCEVGFRGLEHEVVVIGHLAPDVDRPVVPLAAVGQDLKPRFAVGVVEKDVLATVATRSDVV